MNYTSFSGLSKNALINDNNLLTSRKLPRYNYEITFYDMRSYQLHSICSFLNRFGPVTDTIVPGALAV